MTEGGSKTFCGIYQKTKKKKFFFKPFHTFAEDKFTQPIPTSVFNLHPDNTPGNDGGGGGGG